MAALTLRSKRAVAMKIWIVLALLCTAINGGELFGDDTAPSAQPFAWGVCGHPTWSDYAGWVPQNFSRQLEDVQKLGCSYYRFAFEGAEYPSILKSYVPAAQAAGITILPILPIKIDAKDDAKTNYSRNYGIGFAWASYAIQQKYQLPYWELGNELENSSLVKIVYDGTSPNDFPDKDAGGFVAIASSLSGAYHGINDAYSASRASGETTVVPKMLYGCAYHHWGLLAKILQYNGSLPCDIISWHWYIPMCGSFSSPIHDPKSASNNRSPAECLADFKSHSDPQQPMDVWITETNRSAKTPQGFLNGSYSTNAKGEDAEAQAIDTSIADLKKASNVRAIFVYELLDDIQADRSNALRLRDEGHFGLKTTLNGRYKSAFYHYQNDIKENP